MKIGIIGLGTVGGALINSFQKKNIDFYTYDKYPKNGYIQNNSMQNILKTDMVFLCLPTPFDLQSGKFDLNAIEENCNILKKANYQGLVILKSTVTPGTSLILSKKYGLNLIHNPEFLTARTSKEDFENQKHIILGYTVVSNQVKPIKHFYKQHYPKALISVCTSTESESVKLFLNSFYAMKVQIFNEFYDLCQKNRTDFNIIKKLMLQNNWINPMHTNVPGPDGQLSYGGACFPKDTNALLGYMKKYESQCSVLEATIEERNSIRFDG